MCIRDRARRNSEEAARREAGEQARREAAAMLNEITQYTPTPRAKAAPSDDRTADRPASNDDPETPDPPVVPPAQPPAVPQPAYRAGRFSGEREETDTASLLRELSSLGQEDRPRPVLLAKGGQFTQQGRGIGLFSLSAEAPSPVRRLRHGRRLRGRYDGRLRVVVGRRSVGGSIVGRCGFRTGRWRVLGDLVEHGCCLAPSLFAGLAAGGLLGVAPGAFLGGAPGLLLGIRPAGQEAEQHAATEASHQAAEAARLAEDATRREAEEQARRVAAEASRAEAEQDARRQAEQAGRADAEEQAGRAAEERARRNAEEAARREAGEQARREAAAMLNEITQYTPTPRAKAAPSDDRTADRPASNDDPESPVVPPAQPPAVPQPAYRAGRFSGEREETDTASLLRELSSLGQEDRPRPVLLAKGGQFTQQGRGIGLFSLSAEAPSPVRGRRHGRRLRGRYDGCLRVVVGRRSGGGSSVGRCGFRTGRWRVLDDLVEHGCCLAPSLFAGLAAGGLLGVA